MSELCLYSFEACPFAQRTRMVLAEKKVDFRLEEIDLRNKPDGWLEISPYGKVPVLRHDGASVYESSIINEYLDEVFPDPPLLPARAYRPGAGANLDRLLRFGNAGRCSEDTVVGAGPG